MDDRSVRSPSPSMIYARRLASTGETTACADFYSAAEFAPLTAADRHPVVSAHQIQLVAHSDALRPKTISEKYGSRRFQVLEMRRRSSTSASIGHEQRVDMDQRRCPASH